MKIQIRSVLDTLATLAIIATCGVLLFNNYKPKAAVSPRTQLTIPTEPLSLQDTAMKGDPKAKVVMLQYSDFECPFCGTFARETLPQLDQAYVRTGKVLLAFKHNPIERIHKNAFKSAEAAECAGEQGRFWEMHDELFRLPRQLDDAGLMEKASQVELNLPVFATCLQGTKAERIRQQSASAGKLGFPSTPTFLLGTRQPDGRVKVARALAGARPLKEFTETLDGLLESVR